MTTNRLSRHPYDAAARFSLLAASALISNIGILNAQDPFDIEETPERISLRGEALEASILKKG